MKASLLFLEALGDSMEHPVRLGDAESKECPVHLPHCMITCLRVRGGWCTHVIVAGADFESAMPI